MLGPALAQAECCGYVTDGHVEHVVQDDDLSLSSRETSQHPLEVDGQLFGTARGCSFGNRALALATQLAVAAAGEVQRSGHDPAIEMFDLPAPFPRSSDRFVDGILGRGHVAGDQRDGAQDGRVGTAQEVTQVLIRERQRH